MGYWIGYSLILLAGIVLGVGGIIWMQRHPSAWTKVIQNVMLSFLTLFFTFMAAELFFKVAFAQTDGFSQTLANRNWFERYWSLNSMGYRDVEWSEADLKTRKRVLVVGDSLAAGYGIEDIQDRFSNLLGDKLGQEYLVINVATPGISTQQEIDRVKNFPFKPDILILQYYINDIRQAAEAKNQHFYLERIGEPGPILKPLVENSYAFNFIYWRSIRLGPQAWMANYWTWFKGLYRNPDIWWLHQQELITLVNGAASEQVKLIIVIFPALTDVAGSREITGKVATFFEERGVPVIDVTTLVEGIPVDQLVVNPLDAHPNKWLHQVVADRLYELIRDLEGVQAKH